MCSHILVFPYPAQGHMLALLDLTHHLATNGLTITILVTPKNLPILSPLLSSSPNIQTLVLPFPPHPTLPPGVENVKDIGNHGNIPITTSLAKLHDQLIQWFRAHLNPPVAMISDFFLGWSQHLADQLGIPRICFFSSRAFLTLLLDYCCRNISLVRSQDTTVFRELPNSPSFAWEHLPSLIRIGKESDPEWKALIDGHIANKSSWGWVVNTFDALESEYMEYLRKFLGHGRVFGVGPVSLIGGWDPMTRERSVSGSDFDVVGWLDGKGDGSVVYVCFGSQKFLTSDQVEALVSGLEDSGVSYVLVVKPEQGGLVRAGSGRGVVIKGWAPQEAILNHRAVGGFVSHCGWNSVLEAILAGVMILAWPMEAEQYVNARLLVEEHGVAVRVCEGPNTVPDSARLARTIAESMSGDKAEKLKAKEMKNKAIEAVKEGGSSLVDLERLVKELSSFSQK
ncbi:putative UDP-glucuronosyl/UDP-glucosyltransferase [Helianthus annuus]|uniref:UDP-glucuronosyl/UDP-glucosyltransferase n=1 Tax=Helianthus annuus TaxID=4232 RepID=A0A9K3E0H7_HELAN|nr:UDP-glycosyltransferase 89A2-like [Helianthus annuus]KAF5763982.1 putative UDP-glucuronosyl/UDP-glucosyltransferase [Helianthus annuus]KAJ0454987.1 putative UDP-glucuronosyl/UDP-glucosyltransferase [Helianthus annuus]KAJ0652033.1 putative UDP-glucuronosyl/UDP-glucosyltransferase [Helianthus annuus]KAJ0844122.1 putative UDP-glucuronosyl/UDP-glucosyltransferase [Helianthus annuus]